MKQQQGAPTYAALGVTGEAAFALLTWGRGASAAKAAQLFASVSVSPECLLMPKVVYKKIGPNAALIYTFCSLSKVDCESGICTIAEGVATSGEAAWHFL